MRVRVVPFDSSWRRYYDEYALGIDRKIPAYAGMT